MKERNVRSVTRAEMQPGGTDAHRVRLVLPPGNWSEFDPFLMMAEDWFTPGTFGDHPHRGIETVTYVIEGELTHRDNHGGSGVLRAGDAQWMTAGRGIVHAEEPVGLVHSLQLWVNLPAREKMAPPRYQDLRGASVPLRVEQGVEMRVFSGSSGALRAATENHVPITMIDMRLEGSARVAQEIPAGDNCFLYILSGSARIGTTRVEEADVVWMDFANELTTVTLEAIEPLHAILWSGAPVHEPVVAHGPFVMNTMAEIRQAFEDYWAGKF